MTDTGSDVLFIEANVVKSSGAKGGLTLTGQLGDVMKESAIPKDGPSVGITTTTALASLLTGCPRAARRGLAA